MARIEEEIKHLNEQIDDINQQLEELNINQKKMESEINSFPPDDHLQIQLELFSKTTVRLDNLMEQEKNIEERYKLKVSEWRALQMSLLEQTAEWSLLKNESQISEAIEQCSVYNSYISELYSIWIQYRNSSENKRSNEGLLADLLLDVEEDQMELVAKKNLIIKRAEQVKLLNQIIKELGIDDIHRQISNFKKERELLGNEISRIQDLREDRSTQIGEAKRDVENCSANLRESEDLLNTKLEKWTKEAHLGLIPLSKEFIELVSKETSIANIVFFCGRVEKEYGKLFSNVNQDRIVSDLTKEFHTSKPNLIEYAIEMEYDTQNSSRIVILSKMDRLHPVTPGLLLSELKQQIEEQQILLTARDRELYEEIIIGSVGKAIRKKIHRARAWVDQMKDLMRQRNTSSGLKLSLNWLPLQRNNENELDTEKLVDLLMLDQHRMDDEQVEQVITHFRVRILQAKQEAQREDGVLRNYIFSQLDYRSWFEFKLEHIKGDRTNYTELTDPKFNVLSGGEKAMAMYIPLFAATYSRYSEANLDAPKIISLDEAFAGVDDANMRDMFHLLTDMGFDYIMTSQVLWGCYDTVPSLAIYEIYRPKDTEFVTLFHYRWDGESKVLIN